MEPLLIHEIQEGDFSKGRKFSREDFEKNTGLKLSLLPIVEKTVAPPGSDIIVYMKERVLPGVDLYAVIAKTNGYATVLGGFYGLEDEKGAYTYDQDDSARNSNVELSGEQGRMPIGFETKYIKEVSINW